MQRTPLPQHPGIYSYVTPSGLTRYGVRARVGGGRQLEKTGFERLADARVWLTREKAKASSGGVRTDPKRARVLTPTQLWPTYLASRVDARAGTITQQKRHWNNLIEPRFGKTPVARITTHAVQEWVTTISRAYSASYCINAVGTLRSILAVAVRDGVLERNPCEGLRLPRKPIRKEQRRYLTVEQIERVARHLRGQNQRAFLALCFMGLRWGELASVRVRDVDFDGRRVFVGTSVSYLPNEDDEWDWVEDATKTNQSRWVHFPVELEPYIRAQAEDKTANDLLFPSQTGGYWRQPALQSAGHRMEWLERALRAADVPYLSPNELRHTAASLMVASGANVRNAAAMLGHSPVMLLQVYSDLYEDDLAETASRLGKFFPSFSPQDAVNEGEAQVTGVSQTA